MILERMKDKKNMSRKKMSRKQEKAMFAKMKNQAYKSYPRIYIPKEQRELKREIVKKAGSTAGAAVGSDIAGPPGGLVGKKAGEYIAEKVYDELDPPKKTNKSKI
jgi:hypothetical protein